ncbi:PREDICTED: uncharacterized protein LOC106817800 [Priapulus caudatus]|uniref:Uncharacterized protein LOC106817800 n=1 Tax=Priapulus caudatus TaxID=37621 RepID=A0ABM1F0L1_PRICU|nr:PREDICTED: uncharacterized protein LOC106817800 [Priapulus caudatus]
MVAGQIMNVNGALLAVYNHNVNLFITVVVDYFSRYIELAKLTQLSSEAIVNHLKSIFARHGVPERVRSDNGPQYSAEEFASFADTYNFTHATSSPLYPQGNAEVERAVQTVKDLVKKAKDPYLALLAYRATPLFNGYSPAELLFGRRVRTNLPQHPTKLNPRWPDMDNLAKTELEYRKKTAETADRRRGARQLIELKEGDNVWVRDKDVAAKVMHKAETPRSYVVETQSGSSLRRNRRSLCKLSPDIEQDFVEKPPDREVHVNTPQAVAHPNSGQLVREQDIPSRELNFNRHEDSISESTDGQLKPSQYVTSVAAACSGDTCAEWRWEHRLPAPPQPRDTGTAIPDLSSPEPDDDDIDSSDDDP